MKMKEQYNKNGADILLDTLQTNNVDTIFGYPGGASIPLYNSLVDTSIEHILARHEQGAAFMAQGYARSTGKIGVVDATSGPGVANTFTAIADAYKDNIAMLLISGQVATSMIGTDAFQELETRSVFSGVTKYFKQIRHIDELVPETIKALHIALSGRPGPVHLDIPKDVFLSPYTGNTCIQEPYTYEMPHVEMTQIQKCIDMLVGAQRPIILVGHGVKLSGAEKEFCRLIEQLGIPVVETALGRGIVPSDHPYNLGMLGMHGLYHANMAVSQADLICNIGSRFDDRIVGSYESFGSQATIIHVDIDKKELGSKIETDLPIHADAKNFISLMGDMYTGHQLDITDWHNKIDEWKNEKPYIIEDNIFGGKQVLDHISKITQKLSKEIIYGVDVGQHQMWASQILQVDAPKNWLFSGGFGTMGFSLPVSIGASVAHPDKKVISISGDGGIQMNIQELGLLLQRDVNALKNLDIKIIILDNEYLGMVRQWQDMFDENKRSSVDILSPDFQKLAGAYGIPAYQITNLEDMKNNLGTILQADGPALIWCKIEKEENVFPMVPYGNRLDEMIFE